MSSPSTTTSPSATASGWARSTGSSASPSAASCTTSTTTQRREQYACDITYGTNNEFGFDYLRDNMKMSAREMVQFGGRPPELAGHYFAIVDEVDSILIDEARTPLIISGPVEDRSDLYTAVDALMFTARERRLRARREAAAGGADRGRQRAHGGVAARRRTCSRSGDLYDIENVTIVHHVQPGAEGAQDVHQGQGLHRQGRPGRHHRRVHRPHDAGPALLGRPASGARGQGEGRRSSPRTRRSPRSPSRTISASTRSSPA